MTQVYNSSSSQNIEFNLFFQEEVSQKASQNSKQKICISKLNIFFVVRLMSTQNETESGSVDENRFSKF